MKVQVSWCSFASRSRKSRSDGHGSGGGSGNGRGRGRGGRFHELSRTPIGKTRLRLSKSEDGNSAVQ